MGGCPCYGPFVGTLNTRCRIILRTQRETLILTTIHVGVGLDGVGRNHAAVVFPNECAVSDISTGVGSLSCSKQLHGWSPYLTSGLKGVILARGHACKQAHMFGGPARLSRQDYTKP